MANDNYWMKDRTYHGKCIILETDLDGFERLVRNTIQRF